jgi:hypothetical protein
MRNHRYQLLSILAAAALAMLLGFSGPLSLVHGADATSILAIQINQSRALLGGVTPGDAPGFPVTITEPGGYVLTGNLTVDADTTAIEIMADDVSVDLNGFAILGPNVCSGSPVTMCTHNGTGQPGQGIFAPLVRLEEADGKAVLGKQERTRARTNITVVNGTVQGMGADGIRIGLNSRVEDVHVSNNGGDGIRTETGSVIRGNTAFQNRVNGISSGGGSVVLENTASSNGTTGLLVGRASSVIGNATRDNGDFGIAVDDSSVVSENTAQLNA